MLRVINIASVKSRAVIGNSALLCAKTTLKWALGSILGRFGCTNEALRVISCTKQSESLWSNQCRWNSDQRCNKNESPKSRMCHFTRLAPNVTVRSRVEIGTTQLQTVDTEHHFWAMFLHSRSAVGSRNACYDIHHNWQKSSTRKWMPVLR